MKMKSIKRVLVASLVATMVFGSVFTVSATSGGTNASSGKEESKKEETPAPAVVESAEVFTSTPAMQENVVSVSAGGAVSVGGASVRSTIAGATIVKSLQGVAVKTPLADVKASLGLTGSQTPYVVAYDTSAKKSPLAMQCVDAAISAAGGSFVSAINVDLCAKDNGKIVTLANGSAAMAAGLPKTADQSKTYYVVCVQPGGVITILEDQDTNPATVTFEIKAGLATYAIASK
ncbi:MAG: hypothetical protein NC548_24130 [Lachnospiraceae bacterium]|nr:hypothetical protein [Lachnospiraceae bacterium]